MNPSTEREEEREREETRSHQVGGGEGHARDRPAQTNVITIVVAMETGTAREDGIIGRGHVPLVLPVTVGTRGHVQRNHHNPKYHRSVCGL